jgi:hypothetical protein
MTALLLIFLLRKGSSLLLNKENPLLGIFLLVAGHISDETVQVFLVVIPISWDKKHHID